MLERLANMLQVECLRLPSIKPFKAMLDLLSFVSVQLANVRLAHAHCFATFVIAHRPTAVLGRTGPGSAK